MVSIVLVSIALMVAFLGCQFSCKEGNKCIPDTSICDGKPDCTDESDEENCNLSNCNGFWCISDEKCISSSWRCDGGDPDCLDGSDEENCEEYACPEIACKNGLQCILHIGMLAIYHFRAIFVTGSVHPDHFELLRAKTYLKLPI